MSRQKNIKIADLEVNNGQIEGLPKNPRFIKDNRFKALVKSIEDAPEMLDPRPLIVYPHEKKYVIIAGNMRFRACKELGYKELPCYVLPEETPAEKLREYAIKDNIGFGQDDWDLLSNEWDAEELKEWGMETPEDWGEDTEIEDIDEEEETEEKNEEAENLLNKAMQQYCGEFKMQIDALEKTGYIFSGLTEGFAKIKFLYAYYYGKRYPRYCSLVFTPEQFKTSANKLSCYDQLQISAERGEAGIAGFRALSHNKNDSLMNLTNGSYPIGASRMPLDFPVELAKQLIDEFGNKGDILDPCHGWGGRLVGALLADVNSYTGVDPSPYAHNGVTKIKNAFQSYTKVNEVNIIESPFEDTNLKKGYYDFALTSPPYSDVEKYEGEETSTKRYSNFDLWVEKFYTPLIKKTYEYLKDGGCFALQVGSQTYQLKEKAFEIGNKVGFVCSLYDVNVLQGTKTNPLHDTSEENSEVVVLMRKPNR